MLESYLSTPKFRYSVKNFLTITATAFIIESEVIEVTIVDRIKELMTQHGDTITTLARALDLPRTTVDSIVKRNTGGMTVETAYKIADYYGVTIDYLYSGSEGLTAKGMIMGSRYDKLDGDGKELIEWVLDHEYKRSSRAYLSSAPTTKVEADMGVVAEDNSDESATNA